ncbi:MAG: hypothetical protein E7218_00750 [Anaerofustis stercorihominis]|nr:hypothetical protein [Anaerofustis stercorihominis]
MKKYIVVVEETVVGEFEVIAENEEEALEITFQKYRNCEFVLEPGEVQYVQMRTVYPYKTEWVEI